MGYRRIRDELEGHKGIHVNDKRVLRICRKCDIKSNIKWKPKSCTRGDRNPDHIAKNYLQENELKVLNNLVSGYFDLAEINELGMVLNKDMYVFQNAFIDANGTLLVSLEDWNTIFATQYGNSKNLAYQNGTIKNNYLSTNISCQNINGKVYVPLREAVNHFGHLSMGWDKQMRKAVVAETSVVDMQKKIRAGQNF